MRKPGGDYTNNGTKKTDIKGDQTGIGRINFFGESQFRLMSDRVTRYGATKFISTHSMPQFNWGFVKRILL